ncbi:hypothetical protein HELRODRAFT_179061 [Helobdella robusta]|uniref:Uncharacterized protein n=1 Tax=Helobdella robusta TaxID=6412 RepID=T1FE46_HELRO|nr:hypothetical protein HELRODRAFT_179061 [Helobdella robusta]ESN95868.1 hypothetical protein HELRODRAFT_179061 [Helobdella robusta]
MTLDPEHSSPWLPASRMTCASGNDVAQQKLSNVSDNLIANEQQSCCSQRLNVSSKCMQMDIKHLINKKEQVSNMGSLVSKQLLQMEQQQNQTKFNSSQLAENILKEETQMVPALYDSHHHLQQQQESDLEKKGLSDLMKCQSHLESHIPPRMVNCQETMVSRTLRMSIVDELCSKNIEENTFRNE